MGAGRLRAEAQDVCHQLLDGPFRECHAQVWVGVDAVPRPAPKGPKRQGAREIPEGEFGPASGLLWAIGQTALLSVLGTFWEMRQLICVISVFGHKPGWDRRGGR